MRKRDLLATGDLNLPARDDAAQPFARTFADFRCFRWRDAGCRSRREDGSGEGMLRISLDRGPLPMAPRRLLLIRSVVLRLVGRMDRRGDGRISIRTFARCATSGRESIGSCRKVGGGWSRE